MKNAFIILGTLIAISPYTGFAGDIKEFFLLFAGLTIAIMGYVVQVVEKPVPPEPPKDDTAGRPADSASPIAPEQAAPVETPTPTEEKI